MTCCLGWDEEEHERLAEMGGEDSFFDFPKDDITARDHTKDSGYGNAEGTFRSQEVRYRENLALVFLSVDCLLQIAETSAD